MTQRQWKTPVLVIADDFTGANDAGAGLARAGARVNVLLDIQAQPDADATDVWVISTDSRSLSGPIAAERTRLALEKWRAVMSDGWVFKKMDSTLRGNPGAETEAALLTSGAPAALIVPAVPKLGRVTRGGLCYIHDRLLTETEFASDPKTPVSQASVIARLQEQSALPAVLLPLAVVRQQGLADAISAAIAGGQKLIVLDAESDEDLQRIMLAASQLSQHPLLVGAAGMSDALSAYLADRPKAPALAVVGSMSEMAGQQIARLQQHYPLQLIDVQIEQLFTTPPWQDGAEWRQAAIRALQQGEHCVIRTCQRVSQRQIIEALCARHGITRQRLGEKICDFLAGLTREVMSEVQPAGLYLSGGDVAVAVSRGLGATGFKISGQVANCVPYGRLSDIKNDLLVLTKAGGFGDENTLVEVFRFIEEKASE